MIARSLAVVIGLGFLLGASAAQTGNTTKAAGKKADVAGVWDAPWGPVTLWTNPVKGGKTRAVTGAYVRARDQIGLIRSGSFDPATGRLEFSLEEPWWGNDTKGSAKFKLAADGKKLEGSYIKTNKDGGRDEGVAALTNWRAAGPTRYWLETKPVQRIVATLTADITHPDSDKIDESVIFAPQPLDLPGQKDVRASLSPQGTIVREEGPLKRPLFMAKISDGRKKLHIVLTIEATLMSRKLQGLAEGQEAPNVADLSAEEVKWYTRYSDNGDLEPNPKPFRDWLGKVGLKRKAGERDMQFAYRAFQYIQRQFRYQSPAGDQSIAAVCVSGQSDCAGLSALFIGVMRDNGVPARALTGHMAASGDNAHVRAEFFARGVGWVPVDAAAATSDREGGGGFAFFGNDPGDLLALSHDPTGRIETFIVGKLPSVSRQGIGYWWRGTGKDEKLLWKNTWTVKK
jgi:hypothetical protein